MRLPGELERFKGLPMRVVFTEVAVTGAPAADKARPVAERDTLAFPGPKYPLLATYVVHLRRVWLSSAACCMGGPLYLAQACSRGPCTTSMLLACKAAMQMPRLGANRVPAVICPASSCCLPCGQYKQSGMCHLHEAQKGSRL